MQYSGSRPHLQSGNVIEKSFIECGREALQEVREAQVSCQLPLQWQVPQVGQQTLHITCRLWSLLSVIEKSFIECGREALQEVREAQVSCQLPLQWQVPQVGQQTLHITCRLWSLLSVMQVSAQQNYVIMVKVLVYVHELVCTSIHSGLIQRVFH